MRKSLILGVVTLLLAVGAAGTHRLRYDSSVFTGRGELTQTRQREVREYPPCIKGVREDRCIQLYERGMRRAYSRWLAEHGATPRDRHAAARAYPTCRSRSDDRCQQRSARNRVRIARAATPARTSRHGHQQRTLARSRTAAARRATSPRRAVDRRASPVRAATRAPAQATPRPQQPRPAARQAAPPRQPSLPNTPGI
jgi:hypothetical protein